MNGFDWDSAATERLRALWAEGHSTAEIGRRMGVSKNAIVSKAHRLDLPARPSPIQRGLQPQNQPRRITDAGKGFGNHVPRHMLAKLGVVQQPAPLPNGAHPASKGDHRPYALRPKNTLGALPLQSPAIPPQRDGQRSAAGDVAVATAPPNAITAPAEMNACKGQPRAADISQSAAHQGVGEHARRAGAGHHFYQHCRWPLGDPRSKDFRFCEAAIPECHRGPKRAYCDTHQRCAWGKPARTAAEIEADERRRVSALRRLGRAA